MSVADRVSRVAFQGERGAFSEEAAGKLLGRSIELVPRPTFEALFTAVDEGAADHALAPIENSLAGSIHRCYDLLLESRLCIAAEVVLPIAHHLIGVPGAAFAQITSVASHPVALAQCEQFFRAHPRIRRLATSDTAGSVREVVRRGDPARAAIAGKRAAEIYGGRILRRHLEDHRENHTRFLLLSPATEPAEGADKLSLVVRVAHRPGALYHALRPFARRGINLLKIESRPLTGRPWEYRFYLDLQASPQDRRLAQALVELGHSAEEVRLLGFYRSAADTGAKPRRKRKGARR